MAQSLKEKTVSALSWSMVEAFAGRLIQFCISVVLTRLLTPHEFGLVGMIALFLALSQTFTDSGFGSSLIQRQTITDRDISSVFFFNIAIGLACAATLFFSAPLIASFYHQPALTNLVRTLSSIIVINSLGTIQTNLLIKRLNFKTQTKISLVSALCSGAVGITMAYKGYGVWSLASQQIVSAVLQTSLLWMLNSWRPIMVCDLKTLRSLFTFGSRLMASNLLNTLFNNLNQVIIGKFFTSSDLGFYTRAQTLVDVPVTSISGMVGRVTFPVFSSIQDNQEKFKNGFKKALTLLMFINFPLMIGLAACANSVIIVLFTSKWESCVLFLQLLSLIGALYPLHAINLSVLTASGRSDLFFRLELIKKGLSILNFIITFKFGIIAIILGQLFFSVVTYYLNSFYTKKLINYTIKEQILDLLPYGLISLGMGTVVYGISFIGITKAWIILSLQITSGAIVYFGFCGIFRLPAFLEAVSLVRQKIFVSRT